MQLKSVYIDGYKNLIDTTINFQSTEIPIAIIGNNGTGKSNLIEALLHIFIGLYFNDPPNFDYHIEYKAHNKEVVITKKGKDDHLIFEIKVDGDTFSRTRFTKRIKETELMPPFPALIFSYYSGTCERTKKLVDKYNKSYLSTIQRRTENLERLFVFSDIDQAEWSLIGLFAHQHTKLLNHLSLSEFDQFSITLTPPVSYSKDVDDPSSWGTKGAVRYFLADLDNYSIESYKPDNTSNTKQNLILRTYVIKKKGLEKLGNSLKKRQTNLFSMLKVLDAKNMLHKVDFGVLNTTSRAVYKTDDLSEGEKQLLCVLGGLKLSYQDECLVLLDEPDTHLNPAWSWEYDSLLKYALDNEQQKGSTVLIATHDPVIISGLNKEQVLIARLDGKRLKYEQPIRNPRGQGVANVLTSEYFGLPSSLDKFTQDKLDKRLLLSYKKEPLTDDERKELKEVNQYLEELGLSISFRDPDYADFEKKRYVK